MFGRRLTYLVTVLEGPDEYVVLNAWCLASDFDKYRSTLAALAQGVKGIGELQSNQTPPVTPRDDTQQYLPEAKPGTTGI